MAITPIEKKIFIIDGSSLMYRAYYALKAMQNLQGKPVGAVYGFCRMIKKLLKNHNPEYLIIAWDAPGITQRHELFPAYKATRQQPPQDLFEQKHLIEHCAEIMGICQVKKNGIEADDIMYSLSQDFIQAGFFVILVTTDKDLDQLVNDSLITYDPFKEEFHDQAAVEKKYGFEAEKLSFYFALIGDASDNIPGVAGIGPKTATDLVKNFASLHDLYNNLDKVSKERTRDLLTANRENAFLSEELFLLQYDDLGISQDMCKFDADQWNRAYAFFKNLNFVSLLKDMPQVIDLNISKKYGFSYTAITTEEQLRLLCSEIQRFGHCAVDTETDGLIPYQSNLVGISLACEVGKAWYIPVSHSYLVGQQLCTEAIHKFLKPILEDMEIKKYLHHAKFDQLILSRYGIEMRGITFDTMIAAHLIAPEGSLSLKTLSKTYLNQDMIPYEDIMAQGDFRTFADVPQGLATEYAAGDAHQTLQLVTILYKKLQDFQQLDLFQAVEMPLMQILYAMEKEGIILDVHALALISEQTSQRLEAIQKQIIALLGPDYQMVNLNSPKQIEEILFEHLKLEPIKKTAKKTGYSTDQEVLAELAVHHPIPALIVSYRELCKLKGTYLDTLPTYVNPFTHRIHTNFKQTTTATGRLACANPNLQNIPVEPIPGITAIRSAFKAPKNHLFISADYSQIELRILAYFSQDKNLIDAFLHNKDIHTNLASGIFNIPPEQVTHEQRQVGKRINFSILYGLTPYGLSKDLRITYHQAEVYIEQYFAQYPMVVPWMNSVIEETKQHGYVTTWYGRRRYIPGIYEKNRSLYELAQRIAINTKIQGTAAEIMKLVMIRLESALQREGFDAKLIVQIHDEILITTPEAILEQVEALVLQVLSTTVTWNIPLQTTIRHGKTWADVTK